MPLAAARGRSSAARARSELKTRLESRRNEIEAAVSTRVAAISEFADDSAYLDGLRGAIVAAVDYGIVAVEAHDSRDLSIPLELLSQARAAARNDVGLETVLRRYFAGYSLLSHFLIEEAGRDNLLNGAELQQLVGAQASLLDRLLAAVSDEYRRERENAPAESGETHRLETVKRLLIGETVNTARLRYDLNGHHVGLVAYGKPEATAEVLRDLASAVDRVPLLVSPGEEASWVWIGGRRPPDLKALEGAITRLLPGDCMVAMGELGSGFTGWRQTHRQAAAAAVVARRVGRQITRYADVAVVASMLADDLLVASLRQLYLLPLQHTRDRGKAARATLRAYFAADRNVSAASAALGLSRHTVSNRIRGIEKQLEGPSTTWATDLELALRLLDASQTTPLDEP